jgi:hypothetical protein
MLSGVLHSDRAIKVNIQIMRVFTRMRKLLETHKEILQKLDNLERKDIEQDEKIILIFDLPQAIRAGKATRTGSSEPKKLRI